MGLARIVGGLGRALVATGVVLLLFVAHQLWGTGIAEARAQDALRDELDQLLAAPAPDRSAPGRGPTTTSPDRTAEPTSASPAAPAPLPGDALALIRIPSIDLEKVVVEGVASEALQRGPGHYPTTPLPGSVGNVGIAGHRTTYGAPFGRLGDLAEGDEIVVATRDGEFRYVVDRLSVVTPEQIEVLDQRPDEARLTLTTCHPRYSARQRLVVSAVLHGPALPADAQDAPAGWSPDGSSPAGSLAEEGGSDDVEGGVEPVPSIDGENDVALGGSLAGDPAARAPAAAWAAATGFLALGAWLVGRRWRPLPSYLVALPLGAATLFRCFEEVARVLPSGL